MVKKVGEKKPTVSKSNEKPKAPRAVNGNGNGNGSRRREIQKYAGKILVSLTQRPSSIERLSEELDISKQLVYRAIHEMVSSGYRIIRDAAGSVRLASIHDQDAVISTQHTWRPTTRILVWAGSELGSIGQQGDLLKTVYKTIISEEKPDFVIALGNVIVGNLSQAKKNETFLTEMPDFYKSAGKKPKLTELMYRAQVNYVANHIGQDVFTSSHDCKTYFISGLRELSFIKKGLEDPLKPICRSRNDLVYQGRNMHIFPVVNTGEPVNILALTSKKSPFRGAYTRGHRPRKTSDAIAGWLINRLRVRGIKDYPQVVLWTDGVGVYTSMNDIAGFHFVSLPKLSVTDSTELELDTPPNLGVVILDITFDADGKLKKHGIECRFRNLAPYVKDRGY